jgi:hypothetical protein
VPVGGRAGARLDHPRVRGAVRPEGRVLARLRARRGDAGRGDLAPGHAGPARPERRPRLRRPPLSRRAGRRGGARRGGSGRARRDRRDPRPEPRCHAGLLPRRRGHGARAPRRLAPHGRPRLPRRRGLPLHHRAGEGPHHRGRRERGARGHRGDRRRGAGIRYSAAIGLASERTGTQRLHVVAEVRSESPPREELAGLAWVPPPPRCSAAPRPGGASATATGRSSPRATRDPCPPRTPRPGPS